MGKQISYPISGLGETKPRNMLSPLQPIVLLMICLSLFSLAHGNTISVKKNCDKSSIVAMLNGIKDYEKSLRGHEVDFVVNVSDKVQAYIPTNCELSQFIFDLISSGFKVIKSWREEPQMFGFEASIVLSSSIFSFSSITLNLVVYHGLGQTKLITGEIIYHNL